MCVYVDIHKVQFTGTQVWATLSMEVGNGLDILKCSTSAMKELIAYEIWYGVIGIVEFVIQISHMEVVLVSYSPPPRPHGIY